MANTKTVLSIGATGSIGVHIVRQLVEKGYRTRAIVRDLERASKCGNNYTDDSRPFIFTLRTKHLA